MTAAILYWENEVDGVRFSCNCDGSLTPFEQWGLISDLRTPSGVPARIAPILCLIDEGLGELGEGGTTVRLPETALADLRPSELEGLGLPPIGPFTLRIEKSGLLTDESFTIQARLIRPGGQPVVNPRIRGVILDVGTRQYTLVNPIFAALRSIDGLNQARDMETRGPYLERLQRSLPPDALADDYVRFVQVARADSFTILPKIDSRGAVDFNVRPSLLRFDPNVEHDVSTERYAALPEARETEWNRQFSNGSTVRQTYAAGVGHYLVLADELKDALSIVKRVQSASKEARAAFVRNPRAFLREHLGDSANEAILEGLFWESGEYGARVREIGLWQPKVLPFVQQSGQEWLPPEEMGLRVGDKIVKIRPDEVKDVLAQLQKARERGETVITYRNEQIPVSDEAIDALKALPVRSDASPESRGVTEELKPKGRIAVLISDNLNTLDYQRISNGRPGQVGLVPAILKGRLYSFQRDGLEWLQNLWVRGAPGGLLADDMGLGKTLQTLAFLGWLRDLQVGGQVNRRPILIVGPTGLLRNWIAEHTIHLKDGGLGEMFEAHGPGIRNLRRSKSKISELESGIPILDLDLLASHDCVLTTYETLRDYQHSFAKVNWAVAVFDEVQKIKNPTSLVTEAAKAINAEFAVALTGTPVENHISDLWCVTDTVQPGRLGALKDFVDYYFPAGMVNQERMRELKTLLIDTQAAPMLRRIKQDHLPGLPQINFQITRTEMPPQQTNAYNEIVAEARASTTDKGAMLKVLQRLRAVSLHPAADFDGNHQSFIDASARLKDTFRILDAIASLGEKALVFVEALALQGVLAELIQRRYALATPPIIVNGSVEGSKRKSRVDLFQSGRGFDVMILSPRAAGVGLTIIEANHVIHLSRWWNPAVEDQATDRVYRIGQQRPVHVYIPLAVHPRLQEGSFDVRLNELLMKKRDLSRNVLAPPVASEADLSDLYHQTVHQES